MGRRRKGDPVHGWICLDKPLDMTSTEAVSKVRRLFNAQKAGHAGTLDPLATGVLPIALGEATKTVSVVQDGTKAYRFTVKWGEETDTDAFGVMPNGAAMVEVPVPSSVAPIRAALAILISLALMLLSI